MDRREWLTAVGAAVSTAMLAPLTPLERIEVGRAVHRAARLGPSGALGEAELELVTVIGDLILPRTDSPSASEVAVPAFIDHMMADWYDDRERADFRRGLEAIETRARDRHQAAFARLTEAQQAALLEALDGSSGPDGSPEQAFGRLKSLTLYGYFTSERVQKEVLRTVIIPGRFDGCVPFPGR